MILPEKFDKELALEYPLKWEYKIIADIKDDIKKVVKTLLGDRDYSLKNSKTSKKGRYQSYTLSVLVHSDDDRKTIYEELKKDTYIKMIL